MGTLHQPGKMAKLLCMLACAGAVSAAPTSVRLGGSEDALIARVMSSLGPSINSAITAAIGGSGPTAGARSSLPITTFQGSVTNGPATSVQFSGSSKGVNSQSKWSSSSASSSKESSSSLLGSSGLSSSGFGSSGLSSSGFGSSSGLSSFGTGSSSLGSSSASKFGSSSSSLSQGQVVES